MKDSYIHIRINGELKQAAQQHAKETGRTLAGLIDWLLRQELKKNGIAERQEGREVMKTWKQENCAVLEQKIEKAIEKEAMKKGLMGSEGVSVTLQLTEPEKNEFLKTELNEKYDWWEFETNGKLTITIADLDKLED